MPDPDLSHRWLHDRVCALRRRTMRRTFDTELSVVSQSVVSQTSDARTASVPRAEPLDHGLRVDLLLGLLTGAGERPELVVTRAGPGMVESHDLAWYAAWAKACAITGRSPGTAWALGRQGFADLRDAEWIRTAPRRHRR